MDKCVPIAAILAAVNPQLPSLTKKQATNLLEPHFKPAAYKCLMFK